MTEKKIANPVETPVVQQVTTPMAEVLEAIITGPILTDAQVDEKMRQLRAKNSVPAPK